jgi:hypothetical protein
MEAPADKNKDKREWIPSTVAEKDLRSYEDEGLNPPRELCAWRSAVGDLVPTPRVGEIVVLMSHIKRGISFPLSDFCSAVLDFFQVQPFQLSPNSVMIMSGFTALCEGYLGVMPSLELFRYYYHVKRVTVYSGGPLQCCGNITFNISRNRTFLDIAGKESVKGWTGSYFYCKDIPKKDHDFGWLTFVDGAASPSPGWTALVPHPLSPLSRRLARRIEKLMERGLKGLDLVYCWITMRIQPLRTVTIFSISTQ